MRPGPDAGHTGPIQFIPDYIATLYRRAKARGGVAPAHLLDVQTAAGDVFHWSDRDLFGIPAIIMTDAEAVTGLASYSRWLMDVGTFSFNRSLKTDIGSLKVQNLSGDVLQSDFERIVRRSTLEGALCVYRYFSVDLQYAWIEQHGTLSVGDTPRTAASLSLTQLNQGQDDTPEQTVSETCQLEWGLGRCQATGTTECLYSFASCQVPPHFVGIQTGFETNNPEAPAELPVRPVNRARPW